MQLNQMSLVTAILSEIGRQCKEHGIADEVQPYVINSVITGANLIVAEAQREPRMATAGMGLAAWLGSDDTGLSSKAMARHLLRAYTKEGDQLCYPLDPSDFGRCHRFLQAVPEAVPLLPQMAAASPAWSRLISAWPELTALYLEELPTKKAPRLYTRMKELINQPTP